MPEEQPRSRAARAAAERALVRVVHHYGSTPEFVLIGGLVPELLCSGSAFEHSGTTDVDVQVNLEIAAGAVNAANLERALRNAEFEPDEERVWRWKSTEDRATATVKFELLADLETERSGSTIEFVGCEALGAANLRGTGYAVRDRQLHTLTTRWKGGAAKRRSLRDRAGRVPDGQVRGGAIATQEQGLVRHRLRACPQRPWRPAAGGPARPRLSSPGSWWAQALRWTTCATTSQMSTPRGRGRTPTR